VYNEDSQLSPWTIGHKYGSSLRIQNVDEKLTSTVGNPEKVNENPHHSNLKTTIIYLCHFLNGFASYFNMITWIILFESYIFNLLFSHAKTSMYSRTKASIFFLS
jgi:hypothetical protein